jgi:hypothetical protein
MQMRFGNEVSSLFTFFQIWKEEVSIQLLQLLAIRFLFVKDAKRLVKYAYSNFIVVLAFLIKKT